MLLYLELIPPHSATLKCEPAYYAFNLGDPLLNRGYPNRNKEASTIENEIILSCMRCQDDLLFIDGGH